MFMQCRAALLGCAISVLVGSLAAQTPMIPPPAPTPVVDPPPAREVVAAYVNGQAIPELAIWRNTVRVPPHLREERRPHVLNYLIDNTIVDQYLLQLKIQVDPKEVQQEIDKIEADAAKAIPPQKLEDVLKQLMITKADFQTELMAALRWDKFVLQYGSDKVLQDLFAKNMDMFNGSLVQARHILIPVVGGNKDAAQAKAAAIKKSIEDRVAQATAALPPTMSAIDRQKEHASVLTKIFAEVALKESSCPSKNDGGDLGSFPRVGKMVEPFARAAFSLKPYQMSDPVPTQFGYHLILAVDYKPGKEVKFEQRKAYVQEVFAERMREQILGHYKAKSKVEIVERKK